MGHWALGLLIGWLLLPGWSGAAPLTAQPALRSACGPYKLAFYRYGKLYFEDEQGRAVGIDKDLADELARRTGCRFETVVESRVRIWDQLQHGQLQLTLSGNPNPDREAYAEFVPYLQTRYHVLMGRELAARVGSMAAFRANPAPRLGVVKGYVHGPTLDAWIQALRVQGRVSEAPDFDTVVKQLRAGRVDAILAVPSFWPSVDEAFESADPPVKLDWAPADRALASLVMSRSGVSAADRRRLRAGMQAMLRDGTVHRIASRYSGEAVARALRLQPGD